jgi:hypothetical protein
LLKIAPHWKLSLLGIRDAEFLRQYLPQVLNPEQHRAVYGSDLILLGVEGEQQLKRVEPLKKYLAAGGQIWVVFPRGAVLPIDCEQAETFSETHDVLCIFS